MDRRTKGSTRCCDPSDPSFFSPSSPTKTRTWSPVRRRTSMTALCIAVVGPGDGAPAGSVADAEALGRLVAAHGWVTLCGGRDAGVMAAATRGAHAAGGLSIGLLPNADRAGAAPALTVALPTGLG